MYSSQEWWSNTDSGGPDPGDPVGESLRFRGAQYLQCVNGLTTTLDTQTWSLWFKRGAQSGYNYLIGSSNGYGFGFDTANPNKLAANNAGGISNEELRDPSAWYHLVVSGDSSSSRQWINGRELTGITKLLDPFWIAGTQLEIGTLYSPSIATYGYDGHMAEIHFIDGQALEATAFGRYNDSNVWVPVDPKKDGDTAWYGANGFHLDFADPFDVGKDYSGNGNNFTATGFDTEPYSPIPYTFTGSVGGGYPINEDPYYNTPFRLPSSYITGPSVGSKWEWSPAIPFTTLGMNFQGRTADYGGTTYRLTFGDGTTQDVAWNNPPQSITEAYIEPITTAATSLASVEVIAVAGLAQGGWAGLTIDGSKLHYNPNQPGPTYDLMQDSPTNNFATINPNSTSWFAGGGSAANSIWDANLTSYTNTSCYNALTQLPQPGQKLYMECYNNLYYMGFVRQGFPIHTSYLGSLENGLGFYINGTIYRSGGVVGNSLSFGADDTVMLAYDVDTGNVWQGVNGTWYNSGDPAAGTNPTYTLPVGELWEFASQDQARNPLNLGQKPYQYTLPEGFTSLSTANMPEVTIADGRDHFQAITGAGTGVATGADQTPGNWVEHLYTAVPGGTNYGPLGKSFNSTYPATKAFDGLATSASFAGTSTVGNFIVFKPDAPITVNTSLRVFMRQVQEGNKYSINGGALLTQPSKTDASGTYGWVDLSFTGSLVEFGVQEGSGDNCFVSAIEIDGKILVSTGILDLAKATFPDGLWWIKDRTVSQQHQLLDSVRGGDLAFNSPSVGPETAYTAPTGNSVAWCWNYDASNPSSNGFEIVTYSGTGVQRTVDHNLGSVPEFMVVKNRDNSSNTHFCVYHTSVGATQTAYLNTNSVFFNDANMWANTEPTATQFTVGTNQAANNSGQDIVAYLWTSVPGYSAFGSYTGNGNANGPFVYCGFRPAFVLIKRTDAAGGWFIQDSTRDPFNPSDKDLRAELADGEATGSLYYIDFLSNGFKFRNTWSQMNGPGGTFTYAAFAENPFQSPTTAR